MLTDVISNLKKAGTDFMSPTAAVIFETEARKDPSNVSLPEDVTTKLRLVHFLRDDQKVPEGPFFYAAWQYHADRLPVTEYLP